MKNRSLLSLIALLLITALLLISCSAPDNSDDGDDSTKLPEQETNRKDVLAAWSEYISYIPEEADPVYTVTPVVSDLDSAGKIYGEMLLVTNEKDVEVTPEDPDPSDGVVPAPVKIATETTYGLYNVNTGAFVRSFVSFVPEIDGNGMMDDSIDLATKSVYYVTGEGLRGMICVYKLTFSLKDAEPGQILDTKDVNNYEQNVSYDYYLADGTEFLKDLKTLINVGTCIRSVNNSSARSAGRFLLDVEEKDSTYLIEEGKTVVATFGYKMEYDIPVYDEDEENIDGAGYAYFEKGGNKYLIVEEKHEKKFIGEMALIRVPGISISVLDADGKVKVNYTSESYSVCGYAVLSNGNIYLCEYDLLNADAQEYDIENSGEKLNVTHKIINVSNGSVSTLDLSFVASNLLNDTTKDINAELNMNLIRSNDLDKVDVKDGYILATIQKFADGKLDAQSALVVLNENFEIVKELPKIVANQYAYPSFIDADTMIVASTSVIFPEYDWITEKTKVVYYAFDVDGENVSLYPDFEEKGNVEPITGGYVWWKGASCKLYSSDWELLKDFTDVDYDNDDYNSDYRVINGKLYYEFHDVYNDEGDENVSIKRVSISYTPDYSYDYSITDKEDAGNNNNPTMIANLEETTVASNAEFYTLYDGVLETANSSNGVWNYYNSNGSILFSVGEDAINQVKVDDKNSTSFTYYGDVSVVNITETEAGYIACFRIYWSRGDYSVTTDLPTSFTTYKYVVIK